MVCNSKVIESKHSFSEINIASVPGLPTPMHAQKIVTCMDMYIFFVFTGRYIRSSLVPRPLLESYGEGLEPRLMLIHIP